MDRDGGRKQFYSLLALEKEKGRLTVMESLDLAHDLLVRIQANLKQKRIGKEDEKRKERLAGLSNIYEYGGLPSTMTWSPAVRPSALILNWRLQ